jgi:hypothetical protein
MVTAISDRRLLAGAFVALLVLAGCGGASQAGSPAPRNATFAWVRPAAIPEGWHVAVLPSGAARVAYPPGWRPIKTDPGTVSGAMLGSHGVIRGYLNATPQSGAGTLANWARFRPAHNGEEGDRDIVTEASATGLRFRAGTGSCVMDRYATSLARYREIACIVRGEQATTVVVGAALVRDWTRLAPHLKQAVASFST